MFILRMIFRSFSRQFRRRLLVAITICLSSAVATAMLGVVFDVGDKLNEELSAYGSNIVIESKSDAVVADLYETVDGSDTEPTSFLKESDIQKIKTIFWAYNITNFAPKLNLHADITAGAGGDTATVPVVGTWFNTTLHLATGETSVVGVQGMRSWWTINGRWARDDADEAMIGADLADQLHIDAPGMTITLSRGNAAATVTVVGIYDSGDEEKGAVYVPSATLQELSGLTGSVDEVEVKALTTPENDLARKVSRNPAAVTQEEWETWYCTAYASSIAYQIEEVLPDAVAKQIRQISELQGDVLNKTRAVMIVMTGLSLLAAAIAVANLMAASITERSSELALLKAIGATDGAVSRLMLLETAVIALIGALAGAGLGVGAAQLADVRKNVIGLVFQKFHLVPHLTAVENVMVAQYYHSVVDEVQAMAALERVGLKERAHHLPAQLSGGEQQRVCIARALINCPKLVLADEPTGNLDERNERIVLDLFRQLHEQGTTIIVVTHDALVASCAQREIMLNHGVLVGERWNDETARLAYEAAGGRPASTGAQVEGAQTGETAMAFADPTKAAKTGA